MKNSPVNTIRLLIIEDNRLLREGIRAIVEKQPGMRVVGAFGDTRTVLPKVRELKPTIVLLDLGERDLDSLQIVKSIREGCPASGVIVMDLLPTQAEVLELIEAGVSGFILKDASAEDFLGTVRQVAGGVSVLPDHLAGPLFTQIVERDVSGSRQSVQQGSVRMTKRERQVMELIAEGESNKAIAQKLHVSTFTVKSHVHNILEKLGLHTRVQIARYAHMRGNGAKTDNYASPADPS